MPAHPMSRPVRFTLAVGTNVIFGHLGHGLPTVHPVRVVECAELLADDLFKNAEQTRGRITFGDVERHLRQLANHPRDCGCGRRAPAPRVSAQRVYAIATGWQRQVRATRVRALR